LTRSRRQFLESMAIGSMAATTPAAKPSRAKAAPPPASGSHMRPFELEEATVSEFQEGMRSGKFTARSITEKYLRRIEEADKNGPAVNSVLELNPDALKIAADLDHERKEKGPRGPLHGIPILIKANIGTHDRMTTTAGSLALAGSIPRQDSFVAKKLRQAGAIILGKTNLSEWANFRSNHSTSGWSAQGGLTHNPYALDRNPCGSSSGSGAGASASFCALAIGTETDGSIVCPSSANGIVGIKPTVGLISRSVIIPISRSQDTAGPMARTVTDAAILLGALAGPDPEDPFTAASRGKALADYTRFLDPRGLRGARIGVARGMFNSNGKVNKLMENAIDIMKHERAEAIDPADIPTLGKLDDTEELVMLYEFKAGINRYLAALGPQAPVQSLKQIIAFNERHWKEEMPYFGQDLFVKAERMGPLTSREYISALQHGHRMTRAKGIDAVMDKHRLDALVAPTGGPSWTTDLVNGDHDTGGSSGPAAVAGYPHITVPMGFVFGLPVGISFFGRAWSEPVLVRLAGAFEQATHFRQPPKFLPTADLDVT
jgi:amidase